MALACDMIDGLTAQYILADKAYDADRFYLKIIQQGGDPIVAASPPSRTRPVMLSVTHIVGAYRL
mgnify:CR=1 FL=1